ncbi:hypothetical protein [Tenggerimyces flavus]|uniref:Uncharacterized protein n=1 Tax=Tenggerimyces flavus TaxID=1708749 RepID=A0ABV7Y9C5_9ACTN|nr:hypothetical protein [Tenggerimyces flavus]MBM7785633.1 hypothetical protein [Tenggerimyces flavus]
MNLADLRAELAHRAEDPEAGVDLLPGVQRKIRTTRRNRRVAGSAVVVVALVAVAVGVLPDLTRDSSPEPAKSPSPGPTEDYVAEGVRFPLHLEGATLQKAFVGNPGQTQTTFEWTPGADALTVAGVCSADNPDDSVLEITIDGLAVSSTACSGRELHGSSTYSADSGLWTIARPGRASTVTLRVETLDGKLVGDRAAVMGVGLYTPAPAEQDPMPRRTPPASPDDYVNDGFRYRSQVGGRSLVGARIGAPAQNTLAFEFTPSSKQVRVAPFCHGDGTQSVKVSINGVESEYFHGCHLERREVGGLAVSAGMAGEGWPGVKVGQPNTVTVRLVDGRGKTVAGRARIGVGVYQDGEKRRLVAGDSSVEIETLVDYRGYDYRLVDVRTAVADAQKRLTIPTPADTPFVVGYGSAGIGEFGELQLVGLKHQATSDTDVDGFLLQGQWPHPAGEASLRFVQGEPKTGMTYIAIYEPVR